MNLESVDVTAGLGGFLAFFLLAVALYFLMRNMNTHLRRLSYREERENRPDSSGSGSGPQDGPHLG